MLNRLLHCLNLKNSLKHGQDQNANAAYANKMKLPVEHNTRYA